jgi:uncharacterized coiled-coil protein SlyX
MSQKLNLIRLILPLLVCFGLAPMAQAVGPDTDGSIAGANNGEGVGVLVNLGGGIWNTGTGFEALNHDTVGRLNTATGVRALFNDTSGSYNTADGVQALFMNVDGWFNSAVGAYALANNIEGDGNTAVGYTALWRSTDFYNTAVGYAALYRNTGFANTAVGAFALFNNTVSDNSSNAFGYQALFSQTTGLYNNGFGWDALYSNQTGSNNTAIGDGAGISVTGSDNTCLGANTGGGAVNNNTYVGSGVNGGAEPDDGSQTYINGNWFTSQPYMSGTNDAVTVNANGRLGYAQNVAFTSPSSRHYKHDVKPMGNTSEVLFSLKPVTFRYNKDLDRTEAQRWGLIAEEVEKLNPDLISRNRQGQVEFVRYEAVNAMLLNEFLKEHKRVEAQQATIAELKSTVAQQQKGMEVLTAQLKEQAAQIQKVSAQIEASKPAPKVVVNTP